MTYILKYVICYLWIIKKKKNQGVLMKTFCGIVAFLLFFSIVGMVGAIIVAIVKEIALTVFLLQGGIIGLVVGIFVLLAIGVGIGEFLLFLGEILLGFL